eukprot:gene1906-2239_t
MAYLDWQETQADTGATMRLYERCLIPCANYPEFWQRYLLWCQVAQPDAAAAVLSRAATVFCKRRPDFCTFAARFYEGHEQLEAAREMYQHLLATIAPGLLEVAVAAANFERRVAGTAAACGVFDKLLAQDAAGQDKANSGSQSSSIGGGNSVGAVYVLYANFLKQVCNNVERAREVLQQGLASSAAADSKLLWEGALFFEETVPGDDRVQRVLALYDRLLATQQPNDHSSSSGDDAEPAAQSVHKAAGTPAGHVDDAPAAAGDASATPASKFDVDVLEEFSKRCIEFADMYADVATGYDRSYDRGYGGY